jgi:hypothetical protein
MQVPSSDVEARLSALEAYVDIPTEHNGTTVTGRLEAQHKLLLAIRADYTDFRAEFNAFRAETDHRLTGVETRLSGVETRLTQVEDGIGQVLHGMTEIKRLLIPRDGSP